MECCPPISARRTKPCMTLGWVFRVLLITLALGTQISAAASGLRVEAPWARASLGGVRNAIIYGTIVNDGPNGVRLVGGSTPVATHVEFHIHAMNGDVMTMKQLDSIDLKPGETVTLKPAGLHIMLIDLKRPLQEGESFPLTLMQSGGASITLEVKVLGATAQGPTP